VSLFHVSATYSYMKLCPNW